MSRCCSFAHSAQCCCCLDMCLRVVWRGGCIRHREGNKPKNMVYTMQCPKVDCWLVPGLALSLDYNDLNTCSENHFGCQVTTTTTHNYLRHDFVDHGPKHARLQLQLHKTSREK